MSLPPLNFTPREAAAIAVALSRSEHVLFSRDARSAMQKIVAAMPERALQEARATAEKVRLLVQPAPDPDAEIAETIWRAVRDNHVTRIRRLWAAFVGPEATATNHVVTAAATSLGAGIATLIVRGRHGNTADAVVATLLATDLAGGVYVNNRACARWYERAGQGDAEHLKFAASHVHPGAVAWLDRQTHQGLPGWAWAVAHYAYMMGATVAIRRAPQRRRAVGVGSASG